MQFIPVRGNFYKRESVLVDVSGKPLANEWRTNESNVRRTLDMLRENKNRIDLEISVNEEVLAGVIEAAKDTELLPPLEGENI